MTTAQATQAPKRRPPAPRVGKRPRIVIGLGIGYIVLSVIIVLGSLSSLVMGVYLEQVFAQEMGELGLEHGNMSEMMAQMDPEVREFPLIFRLMLFYMANMAAVSGIFAFAGLLLLITAIFFLLLKSWARTALEICSWIAAAFIIILGALFIAVGFMGEEGTPFFFGLLWLFMSLLMVVSFAAVPGVGIYLLRSGKVREAFGH